MIDIVDNLLGMKVIEMGLGRPIGKILKVGRVIWIKCEILISWRVNGERRGNGDEVHF